MENSNANQKNNAMRPSDGSFQVSDLWPVVSNGHWTSDKMW